MGDVAGGSGSASTAPRRSLGPWGETVNKQNEREKSVLSRIYGLLLEPERDSTLASGLAISQPLSTPLGQGVAPCQLAGRWGGREKRVQTTTTERPSPNTSEASPGFILKKHASSAWPSLSHLLHTVTPTAPPPRNAAHASLQAQHWMKFAGLFGTCAAPRQTCERAFPVGRRWSISVVAFLLGREKKQGNTTRDRPMVHYGGPQRHTDASLRVRARRTEIGILPGPLIPGEMAALYHCAVRVYSHIHAGMRKTGGPETIKRPYGSKGTKGLVSA